MIVKKIACSNLAEIVFIVSLFLFAIQCSLEGVIVNNAIFGWNSKTLGFLKFLMDSAMLSKLPHQHILKILTF